MHVIEVAINMAYNEIKYRARLVKEYGRIPTIMASEGRLSQVFLNLLINATHAIEEGDIENNEIRVRTWSDEHYVYAEVRDSGSGIAAENMENLFEPFFSTKEIGRGSGLGLAISKNIIEGYGGDISVESQVGAGTAFTLRIPLRTRSDATESKPVAGTSTTPAKGRILVVDDEAGIRAVMLRMLRGHDTAEAASGAAARQLLEKDQGFDLILCDMMMPEVSGMDLHQWLLATHPHLAERLIFVTGGAFTPKAREYLNKVDNIRLEKPFDVANFKKIVNDRVMLARKERDP
jgi:CheY-like chemotaxis protein/anti-sigma regulatory factor (Ser/Thr protein kinase)